MEIDSIEIDPDVIDVARRFFHFREDAHQRVHSGDGREFLARTEARFDLILLDAYYADNMPFHLITREFFDTARTEVDAGGRAGAQSHRIVAGPDSAVVRAAIKTLSGVFPQLYNLSHVRQPRPGAERGSEHRGPGQQGIGSHEHEGDGTAGHRPRPGPLSRPGRQDPKGAL